MRKTRLFIILALLVSFSISSYSQNEDEALFIRDFERNYDSLLNSFYIKKNRYHIETHHGVNSAFTSASSLHDTVFINRLNRIPSSIKLTYNSHVRNIIEFYIDKITEKTSLMIGLSEYYFPIFESILDQHNAPIELKYLAVIESALNPNAVSRAGATGLWQFMYATGKSYDLRVNTIIDDRKDPIKSSVAAAKYLSDLNKIYNDWELALAAYNCGPGNVNRAMRRSGKRNFWDIYNFLPRETRGYIPAYIAATYVMNYYKDHGITPVKLSKPIATDTVMLSKNIDLEVVSIVLGVSLEEIKDLNPQYKQNQIPGSSGEYSLKLAINDINRFAALEDSISRTGLNDNDEPALFEYREENIVHKVRSGETWTSIARKHGVKINDIKKWNKVGKYPLIGQTLNIKKQVKVEIKEGEQNSPFKDELATAVDNPGNVTTPQTKPIEENKPKRVTYRVKRGDSLYKIARNYGVTVDHLRRVNNFKAKNPVIKPGQIIIIRVS